jgi:hypothetical protein
MSWYFYVIYFIFPHLQSGKSSCFSISHFTEDCTHEKEPLECSGRLRHFYGAHFMGIYCNLTCINKVQYYLLRSQNCREPFWWRRRNRSCIMMPLWAPALSDPSSSCVVINMTWFETVYNLFYDWHSLPLWNLFIIEEPIQRCGTRSTRSCIFLADLLYIVRAPYIHTI